MTATALSNLVASCGFFLSPPPSGGCNSNPAMMSWSKPIRLALSDHTKGRATMRRIFRLVACVVAVACIQTFKGYGVVHDRVELDSLDRFDLPRPEFSCPLFLSPLSRRKPEHEKKWLSRSVLERVRQTWPL